MEGARLRLAFNEKNVVSFYSCRVFTNVTVINRRFLRRAMSEFAR